MLITREEAQALIGKALDLSRATEARVVLSATRGGHIRLAPSGISSTGEVEDQTMTVVSSAGGRRASVTTNVVGAKGIEKAVREAEGLARWSPEDPEYVPEEGPKEIPEVLAYFNETAEAGARLRSAAAATAIEAARQAQGVAGGFCETGESLHAVGTSKGFFAAHRETLATFSATIRTPDGGGSGWEGRQENRISAIQPALLAAEAAGTAARSAHPAAVEPGAYTVILSPDAVAALIPFLLLALDARLAFEGRSFLSKPGGGDRAGERLFGENITLVSDPADIMLSSAPFSPEGVRREKRIWIQAGVVRELSYTRFWGRRQGGRPSGGISTALLLGGPATMEEMIRSTERGLLIRRLHYVNMVDAGRIVLTGLTRDGTFLIEKGKVTVAVTSLRFQESLQTILSSVEALGVPRRTLGEPVMAMPPMKVRSFTITASVPGV